MMSTEMRSFDLHPGTSAFSGQQLNGKLVSSTSLKEQENPGLFKYKDQREDLRKYAAQQGLEITSIAIRKEGTIYNGVFDSNGTLYLFILSSLGIRIQPIDNQTEAWKQFNEISDQEHKENLYLRRELSEDLIDEINAEFQFSLKDSFNDLLKAEGQIKRGHKAYHRFNRKTGKIEIIQAKNPKPEDTEKPLWEMSEEELRAFPEDSKIKVMSDKGSQLHNPVEYGLGKDPFLYIQDYYWNHSPEDRKTLLQMAIGKQFLKLGRFELNYLESELLDRPEFEEGHEVWSGLLKPWRMAYKVSDVGPALFAWMNQDPKAAYQYAPKTFEAIAKQITDKGLHVSKELQEKVTELQNKTKTDAINEAQDRLNKWHERRRLTKEREDKERGKQTSQEDPTRFIDEQAGELDYIELYPSNPFPKDEQEMEYRGYEHVLKTQPKSTLQLRKILKDFVRDNFEGTEEDYGYQTQAYIDLLRANHLLTKLHEYREKLIPAEIVKDKVFNTKAIYNALTAPKEKIKYSDSKEVNQHVYEEEQLPYEAQKVIRDNFDAIFGQYGMYNRDRVNNPVGAEQFRIVKKFKKDSILANHSADGVIRITDDEYKKLVSLFKVLSEIEEGKLEKPQKVLMPGIRGLHTMIHECLHGHSPSQEYKNLGCLIEESSTEIAARFITRKFMEEKGIYNANSFAEDLYRGGNLNDYQGSYGSYIGLILHHTSEQITKEFDDTFYPDSSHIDLFDTVLAPASLGVKTHPDEIVKVNYDAGVAKKHYDPDEFTELFCSKMPLESYIERFYDQNIQIDIANKEKTGKYKDKLGNVLTGLVPDEEVKKEIKKRADNIRKNIAKQLRKHYKDVTK